MSFYVTESVDVDVRVDSNDIVRAINRKRFTNADVIAIVKAGNDYLAGKDVRVTQLTYWDEEWVKLVKVLKQKFPNPNEFEEFLSNNEDLVIR